MEKEESRSVSTVFAGKGAERARFEIGILRESVADRRALEKKHGCAILRVGKRVSKQVSQTTKPP